MELLANCGVVVYGGQSLSVAGAWRMASRQAGSHFAPDGPRWERAKAGPEVSAASMGVTPCQVISCTFIHEVPRGTSLFISHERFLSRSLCVCVCAYVCGGGSGMSCGVRASLHFGAGRGFLFLPWVFHNAASNLSTTYWYHEIRFSQARQLGEGVDWLA